MLTLPIKKKWFDMILSGEKKEEYREIKTYWEVRLRNAFGENGIGVTKKEVMFRNGYGGNAPYFIAVCSFKIGTGRTEWGAEQGKQYFVLTIHEILEVEKKCRKYK